MKKVNVVLFFLSIGVITPRCLFSAESLTDQGEELFTRGNSEEALVNSMRHTNLMQHIWVSCIGKERAVFH
jgi:hypothetical protein